MRTKKNIYISKRFDNYIKQFSKFILISGTGWIIDLVIYYILSNKLNFSVGISNFISAIPAITFVFTISTKRVFENNKNKITIKQKYIIYFIYQMLLISLVSIVAQIIFNKGQQSVFLKYFLIEDNLKLIIKLLITPITIIINFFVMKILSEKA